MAIVSGLIVRRLTINASTSTGEFHRLLARVFRLQGKIVFGRLAPHGVTQGQPRLLHYLLSHDGCIQRDISADNDIEPATVTNALAVMEKAGLVRREGDAEDRRRARVHMTPKGKQAYDQAEAAFAEAEDLCFRGFSPAEKAETMGYLGRIYDNLRSEGAAR